MVRRPALATVLAALLFLAAAALGQQGQDAASSGASETRGFITPTSSGKAQSPSQIPSLTAGHNYALLIATDHYDHWRELTNPLKDATDVMNELKNNYGFDTQLLVDPPLDQILSALSAYHDRGGGYTDADQLMIYIAGHGDYDEKQNRGFIIASDSKQDDPWHRTQLSHDDLRSMLDALPIKHIFVVIDACFGGMFDPRITESSQRGSEYGSISFDQLWRRKVPLVTRQFLTSGGKEFVPDGGGVNSPFARVFLEALRSYGGNDGYLTIAKMRPLFEKMQSDSRQGPFGRDIAGSEFFLVPVKGASPVLAVLATLEHFSNAYQHRSIPELTAVWPGISEKDRKAFANSFKSAESVQMTLHPVGNPLFSGDSAAVVCNRTVTYTFKGGVKQELSGQVTLRLRKQSGMWVIDGVD